MLVSLDTDFRLEFCDTAVFSKNEVFWQQSLRAYNLCFDWPKDLSNYEGFVIAWSKIHQNASCVCVVLLNACPPPLPYPPLLSPPLPYPHLPSPPLVQVCVAAVGVYV